ncbi:hypothetical protein [Arthrobacter sp. U41]|uniref:hypothetical protein n=1 Tax=Arthrobacter sp. U41 TaxID=1849032 RepID=UPI0011A26D48|nr:hypothetical protein [Arthrobacter sp. U41]
MGDSLVDQPRKDAVAVVRWSKKPGESPAGRFFKFSVFGLILCLLLMTILPGFRSFGALALFTAFFATLFTVPAVQRRRDFMCGLTKRLNDTVAEVTNTPGDRLSVKEFERMVKSGEQRPLLVDGVPGLHLHVERIATPEKVVPEKWLAVITVVPPESGTDSFDRLVAAAVGAGPATGTGNSS